MNALYGLFGVTCDGHVAHSMNTYDTFFGKKHIKILLRLACILPAPPRPNHRLPPICHHFTEKIRKLYISKLEYA